MIQQQIENWAKFIVNVQRRWRWIGYILSAAALIYVVVLLFISRSQIMQIHWNTYLIASLYSLGLYLLSLVVQFFNWSRILSFHRRITWEDVSIYSRTILMRRLPGGIWHWIGRAALYSDSAEKISKKVVMLANFLEWAILLLLAGGFVSLGLAQLHPIIRMIILITSLAIAIWLGIAWQPSSTSYNRRLAESMLWLIFYSIAWILGGVIVYLFTHATGGKNGVDLFKSTWIWAATGGSSLLLVIIPAGLGIRELTLTFLLKPFLPPTEAISIAVLIRVTFTLADILWGMLGLGISNLLQRYQNTGKITPLR